MTKRKLCLKKWPTTVIYGFVAFCNVFFTTTVVIDISTREHWRNVLADTIDLYECLKLCTGVEIFWHILYWTSVSRLILCSLYVSNRSNLVLSNAEKNFYRLGGRNYYLSRERSNWKIPWMSYMYNMGRMETSVMNLCNSEKCRANKLQNDVAFCLEKLLIQWIKLFICANFTKIFAPPWLHINIEECSDSNRAALIDHERNVFKRVSKF